MKRSAHPKGRSRREAVAESNVIAEFESGTGVPPVSRASVPLAFVQTYAWGLDLSGTETGAGGVGGLMFVKLHATPGTPVLAPCYDGNGNILAYLDCATGQTLARYEYDPFGKLLLKEEDTRVAGRLHHQFSTKYSDDETGLSYYGYRYYSPEVGRWVNRDPIGEQGGFNLYCAIANNVINYVDPDGRIICWGIDSIISNLIDILVNCNLKEDCQKCCEIKHDAIISLHAIALWREVGELLIANKVSGAVGVAAELIEMEKETLFDLPACKAGCHTSCDLP